LFVVLSVCFENTAAASYTTRATTTAIPEGMNLIFSSSLRVTEITSELDRSFINGNCSLSVLHYFLIKMPVLLHDLQGDKLMKYYPRPSCGKSKIVI